MGDSANILMIPLVANFNRKYGKTDDDMKFHIIPMYVKSLSKYNDETLAKALDRVVDTCPRFPELVDIHKICENVMVIKAVQKPYVPQLSEEAILTSEEGQYALSEGHGHNYYVACHNENKILPAEPIIRDNSNLDWSEFEGTKAYDMVVSHRKTAELRETKLKEKYLNN